METDQSGQHTKEVHLDRLHALCRVCGERSRKRQSDTKHSLSYIALCRHVAPDLLKFHEIDILFDTPDVHSRTLCCKRYARIKKLKFSENPSSTTIQKHRFCGKSLIHRSNLNSARCVQSSPSNVKAGGLSARRRKEPNLLLKTVTEVNWKCQLLSHRQCLRPPKNAIVC